MKRHNDPNDLTDVEIAFLKAPGSNVPPEVKSYLVRQHENLGTKTTAYRKIAAAARAEADAWLAALELNELQGRATTVEAARARLEEAERTNRRLEVTVAAKDERITELVAKPALAVHSVGGRR